MDKNLLIGAVCGAIFGLIQMLIYGGGNFSWLIIPAITGALIGFASTQNLKLNFFLLSAIVGALFFLVLTFLAGDVWWDAMLTGAVNGLLIGAVIHFVGPMLNKA